MSWYERTVRWAEAHRFGVDATTTVLLGLPAVAISLLFVGGTSPLGGSARPVDLLWSVLLIAPLAWRRVWPVPATAVVAVAALGHVACGTPVILPADFAILIALYSVTVHGPAWAHRTAFAVALSGAGVLGVAVWRLAGTPNLDGAVGTSVVAALMATATWAYGLMRRARQEMLETLRERARRLEIERDQQAQIATAAERTRIAREMHDIVAHSLSVVVAQADGGRYAAASDPAAAGRALGVIAETGRAALTDMRRLLGVLRVGDAGDGPAPRAPQPGMSPPAAAVPPEPASSREAGPPQVAPLPDDADLFALLEQARGAGMRVSSVRVGLPRRLPPGAGLTLHRVCQEALTNVRKHAGPEVSVTVVVRWGPASVELEVSDDGRGAAAADGPEPDHPPGYGLLGMGERAALFGGKATAGPRPGGGWRVRFTMPLPTGIKEAQ